MTQPPATRRAGLAWAAASGVLFGSINVAVKWQPIHPLLQSAVSYLTVALLLSPGLRHLRIPAADRWRLGGVALVGGAISPMLLFTGLQSTTAVDSGLLLTLELAATAVLAVLFLRERERPLGWLGITLLLAAAVCVPIGAAVASPAAPSGQGTTAWGAALVALAAVGWAVDNTLSTKLVGSYTPMQVLAVKGLVGGLAALACATATGGLSSHPSALGVGVAVAAGGVLLTGSLLCFYRALQSVGAARTSALNIPLTALASAAGGALVLGERPTWLHLVALLLAAAGVGLLASPRAHSPPVAAASPQPSSTEPE